MADSRLTQIQKPSTSLNVTKDGPPLNRKRGGDARPSSKGEFASQWQNDRARDQMRPQHPRYKQEKENQRVGDLNDQPMMVISGCQEIEGSDRKANGPRPNATSMSLYSYSKNGPKTGKKERSTKKQRNFERMQGLLQERSTTTEFCSNKSQAVSMMHKQTQDERAQEEEEGKACLLPQRHSDDNLSEDLRVQRSEGLCDRLQALESREERRRSEERHEPRGRARSNSAASKSQRQQSSPGRQSSLYVDDDDEEENCVETSDGPYENQDDDYVEGPEHV